jgi:hypothetical protein
VTTLCLSHVPQVACAEAALSTALGMAMDRHVTLCFICSTISSLCLVFSQWLAGWMLTALLGCGDQTLPLSGPAVVNQLGVSGRLLGVQPGQS